MERSWTGRTWYDFLKLYYFLIHFISSEAKLWNPTKLVPYLLSLWLRAGKSLLWASAATSRKHTTYSFCKDSLRGYLWNAPSGAWYRVGTQVREVIFIILYIYLFPHRLSNYRLPRMVTYTWSVGPWRIFSCPNGNYRLLTPKNFSRVKGTDGIDTISSWSKNSNWRTNLISWGTKLFLHASLSLSFHMTSCKSLFKTQVNTTF